MLGFKVLGWLDRYPRLARLAKRLAVEWLVPYNRALGIKMDLSPAAGGEFRLRLPPARRNRNAGGTIHGAAILALAETVHGVAVLWEFPPARHRMVTKEAVVRYLAPARGGIRTRFTLDPRVRDRIRDELTAHGRAAVALACEVTDEQGEPVARLDATYVITLIRTGTDGEPRGQRGRGTICRGIRPADSSQRSSLTQGDQGVT